MKKQNEETQEAKFYRANAGKWIVIAAYGDYRKGVPYGWVYGIAVINGNLKQSSHEKKTERYFYIKKRRYNSREVWGYIINESTDLETSQLFERGEE